MRDFLRDPITETITIAAPIELCFALSTNIELVQRTLGMKPVGVVTEGHITANSRIHWHGWKFGLPTEHHTLITAFEPPQTIELSDGAAKAAFFQDTQERGRFASFQHDHFFREHIIDGEPHTILRDGIHFALPFGIAGRIVAQSIVAPHIRKLAHRRFEMLKALAESKD
jgi:ligand-binding SRPBCC domain-containing protein